MKKVFNCYLVQTPNGLKRCLTEKAVRKIKNPEFIHFAMISQVIKNGLVVKEGINFRVDVSELFID